MRVLQVGIDKSGNYWLWRILRLLMDEAQLPRQSWILNDPIYQVSRTWRLSFPEATELDVVTWDTTPVPAYAGDSYDSQPLRERSYYYCVIPMYRRRIEDVAAYVRSNTHLWTHAPWHDNLPDEFLGGIDKIVYIIRDPRDVLVSGAHFVDSEYCRREFGIPRIPLAHRFRRLLRTVPEWAVHVAGWVGNAPTSGLHIVSYEALIADLPLQLRRLVRYLGLDLDDARLQRVAERAAFDAMKSASPGSHLRKGQAGSWKGELPEAVAREAEAICSPLLELLGYEGATGKLSAFLERGELGNELMRELARINALQAGPAGRARKAPAAGKSAIATNPVQGWR
jgi:hypothetical protein